MRPSASSGVDGYTTFTPGTCMSQASRLWVCCAPKRPLPTVVQIVMGTDETPPDM